VTEWSLDDVLGYLGSWSAVQRYKDAKGQDPLPALRERLDAAWDVTPRGDCAGPSTCAWPGLTPL
jgi:hypothetical protein